MRAIVADDHALVREGLVALFRISQPGWEIGEAASLDELSIMVKTGADLVLADLDMPGMNGAHTLHALRASNPDMKIAVLTGADRRETILACLAAGVHGYILKGQPTSELLNAIRLIVSGGIYVPSRLSSVPEAVKPERPAQPAALGLTPRQNEILNLLACGLSTKSLYRVLDVHTRIEAVVKARAIKDIR